MQPGEKPLSFALYRIKSNQIKHPPKDFCSYLFSGSVDSGNEKYAVMASAPDVRVGEGEYVNRLVREKPTHAYVDASRFSEM